MQTGEQLHCYPQALHRQASRSPFYLAALHYVLHKQCLNQHLLALIFFAGKANDSHCFSPLTAFFQYFYLIPDSAWTLCMPGY